MRVDSKKPDVKKIISIGTAVLIVLMLSNLSLAGIVNVIKEEIDERNVLSPLENKATGDSKPAAPSSTYRPGSSSGPNTGPNSNSGSSDSHKEPVKTDLFSQMKRYTEYYNKGIDEVPDVVKKVAGNDVILLDIAMKDNSDMRIKARTQDGLIVEFRQLASGEDIDPTVTLTGNEDTILAILKSDDPLGCFVNSLNRGSLNVECKGFLKKAALSALRALA